MINIDHSYDSHVHFFGTGIPAIEWFIDSSLKKLTFPEHLKSKDLIQGFGLNLSIHKERVRSIISNNPEKHFFLSTQDGHSSIASHNLIKNLNFTPSNQSLTDENYTLLIEKDRDLFSKLLPKRSASDLKKSALFAQSHFLKAGVTRVRHLTGTADHWKTLIDLDHEKKLSINIEVFFSEFLDQKFEEAVQAYKLSLKSSSPHLDSKGIKIFYDGSFGGNTAHTSALNSSKSRISKNKLSEKMTSVLCNLKTELAIHTIGDLALEEVLECFSEVTTSQNKKLPTLHLEHAPIFSESSLKLLSKSKLNCVFHFQPSHWIDDTKWYEENKSKLQPHKIYPFEFLKEHGYEFYFGSDSPVASPSKELTEKGLKLIELSSKS